MIDKGPLIIVGVITYGHPDQLNYGAIWNEQFGPLEDEIKPFSLDQAFYGAWLFDPDGAQAYLAGMAVSGNSVVPEGCVMRELRGAKYVIFPCSISEITATYNEIYEHWLPESSYEFDTGASDFEFYPPQPGTPAIFIPVKIRPPMVMR